MTATSYLHLHLPGRPPLSTRGRLLLLASIVFTAYLAGFGAYVAMLPEPFTTLPAGLQGLATFTGGYGRVEATLNQLKSGFKGPILISGSHATTRISDIAAQTDTPLTPEESVHIMHDAAATTRENVLSLKVWAGYQGITNVGVITSTYHAARVRLLAGLRAPELHVTILPVQPADAGLMPLIKEYHKLLLAPLLR
jgi:uncharacterized SAM-binding protein YcdF (DUF218 family)